MRGLLVKRKVMIGALVLLFLFALNVVSSEVRGLVISVSSPLQVALWGAGEGISTFFRGGSLRTENELLKQENLAFVQKLVSLQDVAKENDELRKTLDLGLHEDFELVMGEIIGKDIARDSIIIRAGKDKAIQAGMPVVTSWNVAVGRVVDVFAGHARVQLLSAQSKKLDVKIAGTDTTGIVQGRGGQRMSLEFVPQEDEVKTGDLIVTSNLGGAFPENILIGEVSEVLKTGADPFQQANMNSFFDLKKTDFVFVITSPI